jgi:hypothetical protein
VFASGAKARTSHRFNADNRGRFGQFNAFVVE